MIDKLLVYPPEAFKKEFTITSPLSGQVTELHSINDRLIRHGFTGPGAAVSSTASTITAPFDATVIKVCPLDYAIDIKSKIGLKCRIKYGDETQHLMGAQFASTLTRGALVSKSDTLFTVNAGWLKQKGVSNICIMTVLNANALIGVLPTSAKYVEAGEDTLLSLYV